MYIQRLLLLLAILFVVFAPTIESWVMGSHSAWYRPFILWLLIIFMIYLSQRSSPPK